MRKHTELGKRKIRKPYTVLSVATINNEPTMTKQSLTQETDVNKIIERFGPTNIQAAYQFEAIYGDFTSYDLAEAINKVEKAKELFGEVPSDIRTQFGNDPGKYIDFVTNPENFETLKEHGLAYAVENHEEALRGAIDNLAAKIAPPAEPSGGAN
jgi:hypothetical protein